MMIISILELLPTHIITSPTTSLYLFCNSCFELLILATEQVSNTQGLLYTLVRYISITCISNIPLSTLPSFLSTKYSGHIRFQWLFPLQCKHSVSGYGSALGFFAGVTTCLSFYLKFPFLSLCPFLETSDLVNHQYLMLFLDSRALRDVEIGEGRNQEMITRSGNSLDTWRIRRMAKWKKVYLIYRLLMCTLLVFIVIHDTC